MALWAVAALQSKEVVPYKNKNLPIETRVQDLLGRMTLEEKIGQLRCVLGWDAYVANGRNVNISHTYKAWQDKEHVGMLWATYRADPWTKKTLANGLNPMLAATLGNDIQRYALENTRLGIPVFLAEEAPHGHMAIGTTVFPTGIAMAATWDAPLIQQAGQVIAREVRLQGAHISYGPVLDLARDPRWSRVEETYGEDPTLTAVMGAAMVKGLGGGRLAQPSATIATLKHFIAYGATQGGQNGAPSYLGRRELLENFLPPFSRAIEAGALSVMTSYNSMDGIPCTSNKWLLTDVLRGQWGFKGFVVSDLYSIDGIYTTHHTASSLSQAAAQALNAGVDVDLGATAFATLSEALRTNRAQQAAIDSAVCRVLRLKFAMGLFDNPYVDPKRAAAEVRSKVHVEVARKVAQASVTLLKNANSLLPLKKSMKVAVVGPNADNRYNMLGDYTAPQEDGNVKTVLDGIRAKLPSANVLYAKGCAIRDTTQSNIQAAVEAARKADVVVAVVGGSSARDFKTSYQTTGAAVADNKTVSDMECGEGFDRATLELLGHQNKLLAALKATGKPLVVVYIEGRPLEKNWAAHNAGALLTAWYPGQEGGNAIADVLFGDYNPAGRLPISVPRSVGQLPVYYNKKAPWGHNYVEMTCRPLYAFGYGLSYTTFKYDDMTIGTAADGSYAVSFNVTNTGSRDGEEVAQLYLHHRVASTVQPEKQLKNFCRFFLKAGESRRITLNITKADLSVVNLDMQRVVEPGAVDVLVGAASDDIRLKSTLTIE